jgi:hypothetical protein
VCPYGDGKAIFVTVVSDRILDTLGGVRSFWVYSALPVYEHSVINDPVRGEVNDTIVAKGGKDSRRAIYFHRDMTSRDVAAARSGGDMKISAAGKTPVKREVVFTFDERVSP